MTRQSSQHSNHFLEWFKTVAAAQGTLVTNIRKIFYFLLELFFRDLSRFIHDTLHVYKIQCIIIDEVTHSMLKSALDGDESGIKLQ